MIKEELKKFPPGSIGGKFELIKRKDISKSSGKEINRYYLYYFEEDMIISTIEFHKKLKLRNITSKEWHDYHYLPRNENGDIIYPKCKYCENEAIWIEPRYKCYCENCHDKYISDIQRERAINKIKEYGPLKIDLKSFIERYGEEIGAIKYNECRNKISRSRTLEGMIENHGEDEGIKLHEKMCNDISYNRSKKRLIDIYGEEEGEKRYESIQNKRKFSMSKEGYISKYGEIEGNILYEIKTYKRSKLFKEIQKNYSDPRESLKVFKRIKESIDIFKNQNRKSSTVSSVSRMFFTELINRLSNTVFRNFDISENIFYGDNEFKIGTKGTEVPGYFRKPDFFIKCLNIIIEFQGSYWHPRPKSPIFYLDEIDDRMENIITKDYYKLMLYRKLGYYVFYVHEEEFYHNPDLTIEECIKFITNEEFRNEYTRLIDEILV